MTSPQPFTLRGDRPIESATDDRLGRALFAQVLASQILEAPALDSYVVAVMGPWGSGKTSLINMIAEEIQRHSDAVILKFNPWIFSGTEQLVGFFFRELGAQFSELKNDRLATVGASIKKYAGLFGSVVKYIPTVGGLAEKIADVAKDAGDALAEGPSVESQREHIRKQLKTLDKRIIVLVDDIDRLRKDEIRELVKLVRLTGDFPNIVYLLAFDRHRVEAALGEDHETGRAYLEKIVQVAYDVPIPMEADIAKLLFDELNAAITGIEHGPFNEVEWRNIFHSIVRPLIRSPRDVSRYVNALPPTLRVIGREVALVDVLALEAVRVFLPDVFAKLPGLIDALTARADGLSFHDSRQELHTKAVQKLVDDAGDRGEVVREMLLRLFPRSARFLGDSHHGDGFAPAWPQKRRVAMEDVLRFYLERRLPEGVLATAEVETAFASLGDRTALVKMLDKLDPDRLENMLGRLGLFDDELRPEHVEAAVGALLDQVGRLREGRRHIFDFGADLQLEGLVLRLLQRVERESDREEIISRVLPTLRLLSAQRVLIRLAEEHELVGNSVLAPWKSELIQQLLSATSARLADERRLYWLIQEAIEAGGERGERARALIDDDSVLVRLLSSVMGEQSRWSPANGESINEAYLPWKHLLRLFGDSQFQERVRSARARVAVEQLDSRAKRALELAVAYADGWRPTALFGEPDEGPAQVPEDKAAAAADESPTQDAASDDEQPAAAPAE